MIDKHPSRYKLEKSADILTPLLSTSTLPRQHYSSKMSLKLKGISGNSRGELMWDIFIFTPLLYYFIEGVKGCLGR